MRIEVRLRTVSDVDPRRVVLSSNTPHYLYAAQALKAGNILERYITAVGIPEDLILPFFVPPRVRDQLNSRRLWGLDSKDVSSLRLPEITQKLFQILRPKSRNRINWLIANWYDLEAALVQPRCDAFHFVAGIGLFSARKAKRAGATIICDSRQDHPHFQMQILREENRLLGISAPDPNDLALPRMLAEFALTDYFVVPSEFAKRTFVEEGIDGSRIFVNPYGFESKLFHRVGSEPSSTFRILFVGSIVPRKGAHYVVDAFCALNSPNAELLMVGDCQSDMKPLLERHPRIRHIAHVPKVRLLEYYSSASVLVLPSLADAQPLVCLEAMACGLPVIVSENCGTTDLIDDGVDGFVVPIRDSEAIVQRLRILSENGELLAKVSNAAQAKVQEFTWTRYAERTRQMYEAILASANP